MDKKKGKGAGGIFRKKIKNTGDVKKIPKGSFWAVDNLVNGAKAVGQRPET
ncbi:MULTISPECIES: hypothetical protein [Enterobacter]|uniref:hypothetical protein n=1 Tax=Enterobacter TaxID=547 RepID=UPI000A623275|nr:MULTISPECIES: hypothetical protein [Enterobacter]MCE1350561.1 hypothetical protein [Enterobacter roggenkampii]MCE1463783.1 hypothetical protein [Enterobacter roggenkampii]MCK7303607.1 hypothetical protein [Enterobacter roggenkampii]MDU2078591.1 hypothetical protein [Enterobacter sp.]HDT2125634.1 hypothetical protein [Enterobacter roggenkampii]